MKSMRNFLKRSLILAILMIAFRAHADEISVINEKESVTIPFGQTQKFQFGTVPQSDTTVLLKIKSRMDFASLGGSMHFMRIMVNGRELLPAKGRFAQRLKNKPLSSPVAPTLSYSWFDPANGWNVLYAPNFQAALGTDYYVDNPYLYVLDITDLTNPVAENRIEITNTTTPDFVQMHHLLGGKLDLVVGSLEVETKPGASPMMVVPFEAAPIINRGEAAARPAKYAGKVLAGGGFSLTMGDRTYNFASAFSYPDAGFNRLSTGARDSSGHKGWKVSQKGNQIVAQSPDYTVTRTIKFTPPKVEINDAITNRRAEPLGLSVRHELDVSSMKDAAIRLAGNPDPAVTEYHSYGNPSVHVRAGQGALGMIVEDQVFRNQALLYTREDAATKQTVAGLRTEMLRLAPSETYNLQWSVYPVAEPDFYDFINLVREDWGANYTAQGAWVWSLTDLAKLPPEEIRARVKRQHINYVIAPDWVEWAPNKNGTQRIAFGSDVFSDYWAKRRSELQAATKKVRAAVPEIKILWYLNIMRDSSEDALQSFQDSVQVDAAGNPAKTQWAYTGATNSSYTMVPTLENNFGKAALETARRYMDEAKLDGIYWDEVEGIIFNSILYSFNNFDGHSCLLDPETWRMTREVGIMPLAIQGLQEQLIRQTQERGGAMLGNGPTGRKNTLKLHVQRMVEAQHNDYYAFEGLLQTPLAYMSSKESWDNYLRVLKSGLIPAMGFDTKLPHEMAGHLFPFTPIELHSGYLLGKERIIAMHSGNYGWKNERALAQILYFDSQGKIVPNNFVTEIGSEARTSIALQEKEAVVLERLPLRFEPAKPNAKWQAQASQIQGDAEGLSFHLKAPDGGVLVLEPGVLSESNAATVTVQIGNAPARKIKIGKSDVSVSVPAKFTGTIHIIKVLAGK